MPSVFFCCLDPIFSFRNACHVYHIKVTFSSNGFSKTCVAVWIKEELLPCLRILNVLMRFFPMPLNCSKRGDLCRIGLFSSQDKETIRLFLFAAVSQDRISIPALLQHLYPVLSTLYFFLNLQLVFSVNHCSWLQKSN